MRSKVGRPELLSWRVATHFSDETAFGGLAESQKSPKETILCLSASPPPRSQCAMATAATHGRAAVSGALGSGKRGNRVAGDLIDRLSQALGSLPLTQRALVQVRRSWLLQ